MSRQSVELSSVLDHEQPTAKAANPRVRAITPNVRGAGEIDHAITQLDAWLRKHDYRAYDPFDGLNSWARPLAVGDLGRKILQQGIRRFPINLRPLLGVKPSVSSKGFGYLARAYLKLHQRTPEAGHLEQARKCLDWLINNGNRNYPGISWGNHFDYQSRVFYLPRGVPTIVWVSHIGQAFVDAWELTREERYLHTAREVCEFILKGLEHRPEGKGVCLSYIPGHFKSVHNANMLGAALLARVYAVTGEDELRSVAQRAVDFTVGAQLPNGAWWYGEAPNMHWVDNFHTGYVLDALWCYLSNTSDNRHTPAFERGADYFVSNFFLEDGTPKYYHNKVWPLDIQCASQAIESLTLLARVRNDPSLRVLASKVAHWTIQNMRDPSGYFYFRKLPLITNKTPTLHWGQATMMHALACLATDKDGV
jgi:polysaccharide biosynthesis protein VpsJ